MLSCIRWLITCNKSWLKLTYLCVHIRMYMYVFIFLQFVGVMFNVFLPNIIQIVFLFASKNRNLQNLRFYLVNYQAHLVLSKGLHVGETYAHA